VDLFKELQKSLPRLPFALLQEIALESEAVHCPAGTEILREGQYVKAIPLVISGTLKVIAPFEDKELLLYYIRPAQSCALSFSAAIANGPSKIKAQAEDDTDLLLLPAASVQRWTKDYAGFTNLFFAQYELRYADLLETIQELLHSKMDQRLLHFLQEKAQIAHNAPLKLSHRQIAQSLGTAREVISRMIKKLENEGFVSQSKEGILVKNPAHK
jgi:CRP/FNR family transcriptional regulator